MTGQTKTAGGEPAATNGRGEKTFSSCPQYSTTAAALQPLLQQAESRMATDAGRYGAHYLIWLSLHAAANRIKWGAR